MTFQASMRHLPSLVLLAAVAVACPAAAQERVTEPQPKQREAKTTDKAVSADAHEGSAESPPKSRDAKMVETKPRAGNWKTDAIRNDLRIPAKPRDEGEIRTSPCKEGCEQEQPAAASPPVAAPLPQESPRETPEGLSAEDLTASDAASRRRLGQALGAGGAVAAVVGSYLVVATIVARPNTYGEFATGRSAFLIGGLAGIGVGAGLMIGGFSLANANRPASIGMDRVAPDATFVVRPPMGVSLAGKF